MRLLRLITAGAVIGGAVVLIRRLIEQQTEATADAPRTEAAGGTQSRASESPPQSSRGSAGAGTQQSSANGGEPTKAELYERAQQLGIEGRSKMSKRELLRAIEAAG
jgi:DNA end-binding protein Ku